MINLLPLKGKRKIHRLYRTRLVSSALVFLFFAFLISIILMLPALFFVNVKKFEGESRLATTRAAVLLIDDDKIKEETQRVSSRFSFLTREEGVEDILSRIFKSIIESADRTITLRGFTYQKSTTERKIIINGEASDRESLTLFTDRLRENPQYSEVDLPISHFVESKDISFRISIFLSGN